MFGNMRNSSYISCIRLRDNKRQQNEQKDYLH